MYLNNYIKLNCKGHENFEFVDVNLNTDNCIFIDPALIERADDEWCINANKYIQSFFDCLFVALKNDHINDLFDHVHEQNATKLGYGNGNNGKGKTANGLEVSLKELKTLVHEIPTISKGEDVCIFIKNFAKDGMSDLLTNILHEQLNEFTAQQMEKFGIVSSGEKTFWTWNIINSKWHQITRKSWFYEGKELLMVPNWIVRKNYLFNVDRYLYTVIAERIKIDNDWQNMTKEDVIKNMSKNNDDKYWRYATAIEYSKKYPEVLEEYHKKIPMSYNRKKNLMTDKDLDLIIYGDNLQ